MHLFAARYLHIASRAQICTPLRRIQIELGVSLPLFYPYFRPRGFGVLGFFGFWGFGVLGFWSRVQDFGIQGFED